MIPLPFGDETMADLSILNGNVGPVIQGDTIWVYLEIGGTWRILNDCGGS